MLVYWCAGIPYLPWLDRSERVEWTSDLSLVTGEIWSIDDVENTIWYIYNSNKLKMKKQWSLLLIITMGKTCAYQVVKIKMRFKKNYIANCSQVINLTEIKKQKTDNKARNSEWRGSNGKNPLEFRTYQFHWREKNI